MLVQGITSISDNRAWFSYYLVLPVALDRPLADPQRQDIYIHVINFVWTGFRNVAPSTKGISDMNEQYAGFWIRLGATLIDTVIIMIVLMVPLSFIYGEQYWQGAQYIQGFWDLVLGYVVPIVATIWFWQRFMVTPGKMALKLKVVDARTGNKLSLGQAIGRYFAYVLSMLPFGLGFIWIGIDHRKQGWHDKLAGTVVIRDTTPVPVRFDS